MTVKNNRFIFAAAGTGKTTQIVSQALSIPEKEILMTTYTIENTNNIIDEIIRKNGYIPPNITILSWFSFLLTDLIRPYQTFLYDKERISEMVFSNKISNLYTNKTDVDKYYFRRNSSAIYSDKMSAFAYECNKIGDNASVKRLAKRYHYIFIDETQDLSGWDLEVMEDILNSDINVVMVGDSRQTTYKTHQTRKNLAYVDIYTWFEYLVKRNLGKLVVMDKSYRCKQEICDLADSLYPNLPKTTSLNSDTVEHCGLFYIATSDLATYYQKYKKPLILVYDRTSHSKAGGLPTINFGKAKGLTTHRSIIIPNGPIAKFLKTGEHSHIAKSIDKFYVAITRAKYSVAFVTDDTVVLPLVTKYSIF
ncbi:MAG: UvrD-helicase domain-containing protein [Endomicrobium sp.]|jgi:DNA helicase-2/ATP-dependent DNA helicase PcrA|nr:UvrD-helicase domain-containing protein [Endomicrobium sp.]